MEVFDAPARFYSAGTLPLDLKNSLIKIDKHIKIRRMKKKEFL
jgi:hypothetical protein